MSDYTRRFSEDVALLDIIVPQSSSVEVDGSWIDVSKFHRIVAKLSVGAMVATATIDFQVYQAKTAAGGTPKALKVAPQMLAASDGSKERWLEILGEELDTANGYRWVRLQVVCATAASLIQAELLGVVARYQPATIPAHLTVIP